MRSSIVSVNPGDILITPGARQLVVSDVFVPKSTPQARVPARFRDYSRKIVMFKNGTMAPLSDVKRHYRAVEGHADERRTTH